MVNKLTFANKLIFYSSSATSYTFLGKISQFESKFLKLEETKEKDKDSVQTKNQNEQKFFCRFFPKSQ